MSEFLKYLVAREAYSILESNGEESAAQKIIRLIQRHYGEKITTKTLGEIFGEVSKLAAGKNFDSQILSNVINHMVTAVGKKTYNPLAGGEYHWSSTKKAPRISYDILGDPKYRAIMHVANYLRTFEPQISREDLKAKLMQAIEVSTPHQLRSLPGVIDKALNKIYGTTADPETKPAVKRTKKPVKKAQEYKTDQEMIDQLKKNVPQSKTRSEDLTPEEWEQEAAARANKQGQVSVSGKKTTPKEFGDMMRKIHSTTNKADYLK